MKKKNFFICFTGIDGSGKTTLARMTVKMLLQQGTPCIYVYNRFTPFLSKPFTGLGRKLFMSKENVFRNYARHSQAKQLLLKSRILSFFYQFLILFDYYFQNLFKVKLPLMLGKNIVCDRYIYDTLITDLALSIGYSGEVITNMLKRYFYFIPKPDLVFLIDAPEEIAYRRKEDIPCIDYLKARRRFYLDVGKKEKMLPLDGTLGIAKLETQIREKLKQTLFSG